MSLGISTAGSLAGRPPISVGAATSTATSAELVAATSQVFGLVAYANPIGCTRAPSSASTLPISIMVVIDRMVVPNVNVTHTAAGWARVAISVGCCSEHGFIDRSVRNAISMLRSICGAAATFTLDSIVVCGPDLHAAIDEIQHTVRSSWDSLVTTAISNAVATTAIPTAASPLTLSQEHAATSPSQLAKELAAAEARVLRRIAAGGGAPDFSLKTVKGINSARNYIASTQGNTVLSSAMLESVREKLATM